MLLHQRGTSRLALSQTSLLNCLPSMSRQQQKARSPARERAKYPQAKTLNAAASRVLDDLSGSNIAGEATASNRHVGFFVAGWLRALAKANPSDHQPRLKESRCKPIRLRLAKALLRSNPTRCPWCQAKLTALGRGSYVCPDGCWGGYLPDAKLCRPAKDADGAEEKETNV